MAVMEISVVPVGTATPSLSRYVAGAVKLLEGMRNVRYELTAMGTIVEADRVEDLLEAARKLHESVFDAGAMRVLTAIKIDDRRDRKVSIEGKVKSVRDRLGD
jgi:uncharacterized protein (TIGR00106 family)